MATRKTPAARPLPALRLEQPHADAFLARLVEPARRAARAARHAQAGPSLFEAPAANEAAGDGEATRSVPALLFDGPEGTGKLYTAVDFARRLCCERDEPCDLDSSDLCASCRRAANLEHPGIHVVFPTPSQGAGEDSDGDVADIAAALETRRADIFAAHRFARATSIRIARARATLERAAQKPFESPFDVFVFHDAHRMRVEAQNALLKLVEEPPAHVVLIFVTTNPEAILYTIRSRCQRVRFLPLRAEVVERILRGYYGADAKAARRAAALALGSVTRARDLLESGDDSEREAAVAFVEALASHDAAWALEQALSMGRGANREAVGRFLDDVAVILRDVMAGSDAPRINADLAARLDRLSPAWPTARIPALISAIDRARREITVNNATIDATLAGLFLELARARAQSARAAQR